MKIDGYFDENSDEYVVVYPDEKGYYEAYGELYRLYLRDGSIVRSQTYESGFPIYIEDYSGNKVMVVDRGDYAYFVDEANQTITFLTMMGESIVFDNQPLNNPTKYYRLKNDILLLDKDTVGINPSKMPEIRKEIFSLYKDIELKPFSLNLFTEDFNSMKEYLSKEYEFNVYECTDISMNTLDSFSIDEEDDTHLMYISVEGFGSDKDFSSFDDNSSEMKLSISYYYCNKILNEYETVLYGEPVYDYEFAFSVDIVKEKRVDRWDGSDDNPITIEFRFNCKGDLENYINIPDAFLNNFGNDGEFVQEFAYNCSYAKQCGTNPESCFYSLTYSENSFHY